MSNDQFLTTVLRTLRVRRDSLAAIGVLTIAIGLASAAFTVIDAVYLRPVPFDRPEDLAVIHMRNKVGGPRAVPSALLAGWRGTGVFNGVEAAVSGPGFIAADSGIVKQLVARVTPGIFGLLGSIHPLRGRLLLDEDAGGSSGTALLISEDLWRRHFQADPAIIGRVVRFDSSEGTVVGVLPRHVRFPEANTAVWVAARLDDATASAGAPVVYVRYRGDVPRKDALEVATATAQQAGAFREHWAAAMPLVESAESLKQGILLFAGAVLVVFIALCANAGSLVLVGLSARATEFGLCTALGASRGRLLRQGLREALASCLVALLGGYAVAALLVRVAASAIPRTMTAATLNTVDIDAWTFMATAAAAMAALVIACLVPVSVGTRVSTRGLVTLATRSATDDRPAVLSRRVLLGAQVGLSCGLLFIAMGLIGAFLNVTAQARGLETDGVLVARIVFPEKRFASSEARAAAVREVESLVKANPAVRATSWSYGVPPGGGVRPQGPWLVESPGARPVDMAVRQFSIDGSFVSLYGLQIVRGRALDPSDTPDAALVSERMAKALWPSQDVLGLGFTLKDRRRFRVVGVVRDIGYPSADTTMDAPQLYDALGAPGVLSFLSIRCAPECPGTAALEQQLVALGVTASVRTLEDGYEVQVVGPRTSAVFGSVFAAAALVVSTAGLCSLLSRSVRRRRREFAVRLAMGASDQAIRRLIWREVMVSAIPGALIGAIASTGLLRLLAANVAGIVEVSLWSVMATLGVLAVSLLLGAWLPTRNALRTPLTLAMNG